MQLGLTTREVTAVAQTPPCRYHLGLGIYNVQTAVEGMDGNKQSHLLHLCGQLLRLVLIPYHVEREPHQWTRTTALSFAAELDGHVLGTLCAENSNPSWFKNPFYVNPRTYTQMQFLQPTHSEVYANAVPTHKLSGSEQLNPFGRSLRGAVAKTRTKAKQTSEMD